MTSLYLQARYIDPNFPPPGGDGNASIVIYGYTPNYPLTIFAATLFGLSLLIHNYQIYRYHTWYFVTIPIGLALEIVGYVFRSLSAHKNPYSVIYFVLQYFCIVTAPVFLTAGIYAVLSILISRTGAHYSVLSPKAVLAIFISSDAVTTVTQIAGAALIGSAESNGTSPLTGQHILTIGLALQVAITFVFWILLFAFLYKARAVLFHSTPDSQVETYQKSKKGFIIAFVVATALIYLRTCFRLAEVAQGVTSYLFTHEVFFAVLEFAPVAAAVLLFNAWHPGRCLSKMEKRDGIVGSNEAGVERGGEISEAKA